MEAEFTSAINVKRLSRPGPQCEDISEYTQEKSPFSVVFVTSVLIAGQIYRHISEFILERNHINVTIVTSFLTSFQICEHISGKQQRNPAQRLLLTQLFVLRMN